MDYPKGPGTFDPLVAHILDDPLGCQLVKWVGSSGGGTSQPWSVTERKLAIMARRPPFRSERVLYEGQRFVHYCRPKINVRLTQFSEGTQGRFEAKVPLELLEKVLISLGADADFPPTPPRLHVSGAVKDPAGFFFNCFTGRTARFPLILAVERSELLMDLYLVSFRKVAGDI